jgi:hypothetical protein
MKKIILIITFLLGYLTYPEIILAHNESKTELVKVDLSPNQPVHKLFALTIISIDGEPVTHRNEFIMIAAGEHTLKFSANVSLKHFVGNTKILNTKIKQRKYSDTLKLKLEANNEYQLAFDARAHKVEDWKPIVLSVTKKNIK